MKVTVTAEKEGEETRQQVVETAHPKEKVDSLVKRIPGLTSHQAYKLKVDGMTQFEENGWAVTVTLSKD